MNIRELRRLVYSSLGIAVLGIALAMYAYDALGDAQRRADLALGSCAATLARMCPTEDGSSPMVRFEEANREASRATLLLGVAATLTPVLIFLNVLGFSGQHAPPPYTRRLPPRE